MLKRVSLLFLFVALCLNCEKEKPCADGYAKVIEQDGTSTCVLIMEDGIGTDFQLGDRYYHRKHGVITYTDGKWTNTSNQIVTP